MSRNSIMNIAAAVIFLLIFIAVNKPAALILILIYVLVKKYPDIMYLMGSQKYSQNNLTAADKYFKRAYKCFYSPTKLKAFYSYFLILQGRLDEAEKIIKDIRAKKNNLQDSMSLDINYSLVLWKRNELKRAVEVLEALYKNHKTMVIYQNLGYFLLLSGDYERALKFNLEAYEFDSSNAGILDNLAQSYYFTGDYDRAEEIFETLMDKNPTFASAYYYYALALVKKDKKAKALENLNKALNCKFTYLSIITKEEIQSKISEIEGELGS